MRHQAVGELDDTKIIDGLTGEKAIYKRRGELEPQVSIQQEPGKGGEELSQFADFLVVVQYLCSEFEYVI